MARKPLSSSRRIPNSGMTGGVHRTPKEKRDEALLQISNTAQELCDVSLDLELAFLAYLLDMAAEEARRSLVHDYD